MLVYVIVVHVMQMIVMQIAGVIAVLDSLVSARLSVLMVVTSVCVASHKIFAASSKVVTDNF
jgi:hypothetical protein